MFCESKQFDESLSTIKKHLNVYDNEISTVIDKYPEYIGTQEKNVKHSLEAIKMTTVK